MQLPLDPPPRALGAVPSTPGITPHIAALDGIRGIAILMVMVFHFHLPQEAFGWGSRLWDGFAGLGTNGVNLFFVLSGFLITGILWDAKGGKHYLRNFYARRILRIFPLYYGALFVGLVLVPLLHPVSDPKYVFTVRHQGWLWTYLSNVYESWSGRPIPLFGHFWSLAVEEQFYLLWPFVVLWSSRLTLMRICVGCFVGAFVMRLGLLYAGADPATTVLRLAPCELDCLATGAFLALAWRVSDPLRLVTRKIIARRAFAASAAAIALLMLTFSESENGRLISFAALNSGWSIFFGTGLYLAMVGSPGSLWTRALHSSNLRMIGKYSYGLYVFHWPMGRLWLALMNRWQGRQPGSMLDNAAVFQGSYFLLAAGFSLLAAWLSWHLYEKHFLRLKRYFTYERGESIARTVPAVVPST